MVPSYLRLLHEYGNAHEVIVGDSEVNDILALGHDTECAQCHVCLLRHQVSVTRAFYYSVHSAGSLDLKPRINLTADLFGYEAFLRKISTFASTK
jgi:hypothetical protein